MMLYRSLVVGLLGAIAMLVASRPDSTPAAASVPVPVLLAAASDPLPDATVIDVSRAHAGADPMPLLGLSPGERVIAIDGVATDGTRLAGRWDQAFPGEYLDLGVRGVAGDERRILVLVHP